MVQLSLIIRSTLSTGPETEPLSPGAHQSGSGTLTWCQNRKWAHPVVPQSGPSNECYLQVPTNRAQGLSRLARFVDILLQFAHTQGLSNGALGTGPLHVTSPGTRATNVLSRPPKNTAQGPLLPPIQLHWVVLSIDSVRGKTLRHLGHHSR